MALLEGKELEGKIGEAGSYYIDVAANGKVDMHVEASVDKEFIPGVKAKLSLNGDIEVRTATLVAAQAAKSDNKILQYIAKLLADIEDGQEAPAAVMAAMEEHVSPGVAQA